jgi:hypothetical protein
LAKDLVSFLVALTTGILACWSGLFAVLIANSFGKTLPFSLEQVFYFGFFATLIGHLFVAWRFASADRDGLVIMTICFMFLCLLTIQIIKNLPGLVTLGM